MGLYLHIKFCFLLTMSFALSTLTQKEVLKQFGKVAASNQETRRTCWTNLTCNNDPINFPFRSVSGDFFLLALFLSFCDSSSFCLSVFSELMSSLDLRRRGRRCLIFVAPVGHILEVVTWRRTHQMATREKGPARLP